MVNVYYIKLKAVLCWNQDPKVKVKNEADRVLVCQRKAHTHVLTDIWRRERRRGWARRVHVWTLSCLRGRMTESASPHPSHLSVSIFSAASSSPRLPFPHSSIFSPPSSFLHLSHFLIFPSSNLLLSISLLSSSLSTFVSSSSHLPQPYFLHPISLSFSNPSFFPAVIRSVRTAATGWAPNKN